MNSNKPTNIDEYISDFPASIQEVLQEVRNTVRKAAPEATEKISYGMPAFHHNGNLVYFAAYEHHIGFYPTPNAIEAFKKDIAIYKSAKGSVQFPLDQAMPLDLIAQMTEFRVHENLTKSKKQIAS